MFSHNGCLNKKVAELNILSQSLRADCTRYEQELCNALQEQEPLKQRCASLQAETAQHKIQKTALETTLESCKATIKQYEALLEAGEANEKPAKGPRGRPKKEDKEKGVVLQLFWYRVNWKNVFIVEPKQLGDELQSVHPHIFVGVVTDSPYYFRGEEKKELPGSCKLSRAAL
ncbi:hypothetical protein ISCGN_016287 [Ixodes scapularis]